MLLLLIALDTGFFGVSMNYSLHDDIETLNREFIENSLSHKFADESWGWSWSVFGIKNNVIFGLQNINGHQNQEEGNLSLDLSFRTRTYEAGYLIGLTNLMFFLKAGAGYSHIDMTVSSQSDSSTFSGVLSDPGGSAYLTGSTLSLLCNAGMLMPISDYLGILLTGGYIYGLNKPDWKFIEGRQLYEDPDIALVHTYIKVGIVLGEFKR